MVRSIDGTKQCFSCKATKPVSEFGKWIGAADGLYTYCKSCMILINKENAARRKTRRLQKGPPESPANKACPGCNQTKPASEFYKSTMNKDGLGYYCKVCNAEKIEEYEQKTMTSDPRLPADGQQICRRCKERKPIECFSKRRRSKTHLMRYCRECIKPVSTKSHIGSKYGLSLDGYKEMLDEQCHLCYLCGKGETTPSRVAGKLRKLSIDHCHKTGKHRRLLCNRCNISVGGLEHLLDNGLLKKTMLYLKEFQRKHGATNERPI